MKRLSVHAHGFSLQLTKSIHCGMLWGDGHWKTKEFYVPAYEDMDLKIVRIRTLMWFFFYINHVA